MKMWQSKTKRAINLEKKKFSYKKIWKLWKKRKNTETPFSTRREREIFHFKWNNFIADILKKEICLKLLFFPFARWNMKSITNSKRIKNKIGMAWSNNIGGNTLI